MEGTTLVIGVPSELFPGEHRVGIAPVNLPVLTKAGHKVVVQSGAGVAAGFPDSAYVEAGATVAATREEVFAAAEAIVQVRSMGAEGDCWATDRALLKGTHVLIGSCDPLGAPAVIQDAAATGVTAFSMELVPRTTRAQAMDVLSSQANLAGYKAVIMAADALPRIYPMMMTAAGTITPSKVFVVGAGVAGLQAIATARRLGAVVSGYDVRPAVKEQVESLGARFVDLPLDAGESQDSGGYARAMDENFYRKQAELMASVLTDVDVVITTAAIPGQRAPILFTAAMVEGMRPGSVIVDLAAERGGNCEATVPGQTIVHAGVTVMGPTNLPATVPFHASQLYGRNIAAFLANIAKGGEFAPDMNDQIVLETLVCKGGEVVNARVRDKLGLTAPAS